MTTYEQRKFAREHPVQNAVAVSAGKTVGFIRRHKTAIAIAVIGGVLVHRAKSIDNDALDAAENDETVES